MSEHFTIGPDSIAAGRVLETTNLKPPRPGQIVRYFNGRIYIARRDVVYFTEPLRYHLTKPSDGIFVFHDTVTLLEPAVDGLYVGGSFGVRFLGFVDPYQPTQLDVIESPPVPRASMQVVGEALEEPHETLPLWWCRDGVLYKGGPGGAVEPLTEDRLAVSEFGVGAMALREREGMSQVVSVLRQGGSTSGMMAVDSVVAEVRHNGIILNEV